jgi:hypothetical protein
MRGDFSRHGRWFPTHETSAHETVYNRSRKSLSVLILSSRAAEFGLAPTVLFPWASHDWRATNGRFGG